MKKVALSAVLMSLIVLYACNNNASSGTNANTGTEEKKEPEIAKADDLSSNPIYKRGLELIGKSDCLTCHKIEETSTGPAYKEVANKYPNVDNTIDTLASKIINGGSGNWGQVPMTPHAALTLNEAKELAQYVMLFKTNK